MTSDRIDGINTELQERNHKLHEENMMLQNAAHEVEILRVEHHEMESMYEAVRRN